MNTDTRQMLAKAASTVDGINVAPYFRTPTRPGDGSVRLDRMTRDLNGFGFVNTWNVVVLLPEDLASAEKWLDEKAPALIEVLSEHMVCLLYTSDAADDLL